jgi:hypothetical protein
MRRLVSRHFILLLYFSYFFHIYPIYRIYNSDRKASFKGFSSFLNQDAKVMPLSHSYPKYRVHNTEEGILLKVFPRSFVTDAKFHLLFCFNYTLVPFMFHSSLIVGFSRWFFKGKRALGLQSGMVIRLWSLREN